MKYDYLKRLRIVIFAGIGIIMLAAPLAYAGSSLDEMKAKMTSSFEINGLDAQGRCQTITMAIPGQRMDCNFDKSVLQQVSEYSRLMAKATDIESESISHVVNSKMVTESTMTIDGVKIADPWTTALNNGQVQILNGETSQVQTPVEKATGNSANTLFILDASGSMWGQIEGKPKIAIAKEVMAKLVPELPDSSRIGLIAYGHRRKGDCNDVETLVKLGGNHKQAVLDAVKELNAKGKTPLTRSINQAFKMLQSEKQTSTIILVSDGIESCNADPCETVKAAKKYGVNFILYTVGFGLNKKESAQLQCMARAGGGEYFQANNAEELLKSARKAVQPMGVLKLTVEVNGKINDLMYRIEDASTGKIIRQPVLPTSSGRAIQLPGGEYNVFVLPAGVSGAGEQKLSLRMKAGEVIKKTLSFGKGVLRLTVMVNGKPAHALIHIEDSNTHQWVYESSVFGFDTPLDINLAAGKVDIVIQAGGRDIPERRVRGVKIMAGETTAQIIPIEVKAATAISADANGMEQDTDRPGGGDFRHVVPTVDDPAICLKACADDPQCKAWTYVKPNTIQGPTPNCWLKMGTPTAVPNTCCVSGVKPM